MKCYWRSSFVFLVIGLTMVGCNQRSDAPAVGSAEPKTEAPNSAQANRSTTGASNAPRSRDPISQHLYEVKRDQAKLKARNIEMALKAWYIKNDEFPGSLQLLVNPPDGIPFLEGGEDAILDPWGKPFQFKVTPRDDGEMIFVVVWTTDPDGVRIDNARKK